MCNIAGEIGKEMYIVTKGAVQVVGGVPEKVFVTLKEGAVFGEVALLSVGSGNRRTADVRSRGFSTLFVLEKDDLNTVIKDYPIAQRSLRRKAKEMIKKERARNGGSEADGELNLEKEAANIRTNRTPQLFRAVVHTMRPGTETASLLTQVLEKDEEALAAAAANKSAKNIK